MSQVKLIGAQLGMAVFGPTGALVGGIAGAVIDAALPWGDDVVKNAVANLLATRVERVASKWAKGSQTATVNHDLQRAFQDAVREALADIGGPTCFSKAWPAGRRDVPREIVYLSSPLGHTSLQQRAALASQVCQLLTAVARGIEQNELLPLRPAADERAGSAMTYIESTTSQALADSLYDATILPVQQQFGTLFIELPDLEPHLRRFLLDRAMLHFGELLKRRTEPWRAFNRWILEDVRDSLAAVQGENRDIARGVTELNERLDLLLGRDVADLGLGDIAATTADSVGRVRLDVDDTTALINALIEEVTRQQAQQLAELRELITHQTSVILAAINSLDSRITAQLVDLFQRLKLEIRLGATPIQPPAVTPQRGHIMAAFRSEALRLHRTQSIPWRGAGGRAVSLDRVYRTQELAPWDEPEGEDERSSIPSMVHGQSPSAALLDQRAIVVLGEPGSGKTFLLHALGLDLATTCGLAADGAVTLGFLPIFVPLGGFTQATDDLGVDPAARLLGYVQRVVDARTPGMATVLDELMAEGRAAFLFDALDEVSGRAEQHAALAGIQALAAGAGSRCLFALTVREAAYGGSVVLNHPFRAYRLALLATATQPAAIRSWLSVLSDLDERDEDVIENQARRVIEDLDRHPGMRQALRNPLLLRITLQAYLWSRSAETTPGLGKRFDLYVNRLLQGGGETGAREPAWPDPDQARQYLERIAWEMYGGAGLRNLAEAEQLLQTDCGLSQANARLFIRNVQKYAGLLALDSYDGKAARPEQTALSFGPHALFGDFLAGSVLAQRWRADRRRGRQLLRQKADDPAWQQAVFFCLSLLYAEEGERKAAFGFVLDELERVPAWGVRCLRTGLELTADELAPDERRQVVHRLASQAYAVLNPNLVKGLRLRLQHRSDSEFRTALNAQFAALAALGTLQLCEVAEPVMRSVFWLSADYKHVGGVLRSTLVDFGPRCLWPVIQVALLDGEEWVRSSAAWVVSGWHGSDAIPALEWLLEHDEFAKAAVFGLAQVADASVDATYRSLLADPRHADDALSAGLLSQRPGMLEYALGELRANHLAEHHVKFLMEYAFRLSSSEALRTVREMLEMQTTTWPITYVFEVNRTLQLPLLRILVGLLREPDGYLRERVQEAIPRVLKAGDLDPHFQDSQGLLEQIMLYSDDWLPDVALRQLGAVTLSEGASEILWNRLTDPETRPDVLKLLRSRPRLPEAYRQKMIGWLRQEIERTPSYASYFCGVLASLDDRSVIPRIARLLQEAASPWHYDDALIRDLIRLRAREAFPYVVTCMTQRDDWDSDGAVSLGMLAPVLSLEQRREAANLIRPLLKSDQPWLRWVAICALGDLKMGTAQEFLSQIQDDVLEIQEPAIGLALARLGTYDELAAPLQNACAQRDATLYFTALHTWSALRDPRCVNPLLQTLGLPDNFLRSADHLLSGGDLVAALNYLKARAATNLGRLAATLAGVSGSGLDPKRGWDQMLSRIVDRNLAGAPGMVALLRQALEQPAPARLLYDQMLTAKGQKQAVLGWLVGAYDWSEVFAHLGGSHNLDSVPIWEAIHTVFDKSKNDEQAPVQKQLAGRIGWAQAELPFEHLMRLAAHRDQALREQTHDYFAREAREWRDWLKWRADMLVLTVD